MSKNVLTFRKWEDVGSQVASGNLPNNVRGEHVSSPQTCDAKLALRVSFDRAEELR